MELWDTIKEYGEEAVKTVEDVGTVKDVVEIGKDVFNTSRFGETMGLMDMGDQAESLEQLGKSQLETGMGGKLLGAAGTALDVFNVGKGSYEVSKGVGEHDAESGVEGIHDMLEGGLGVGAEALKGTPAGDVMLAAKTGMAIGDMIAPLVFGSDEDSKGAHTEEVPESGEFKASSGNETLDTVIAPLAHAAEWLFG
jgi:hypothetical protein